MLGRWRGCGGRVWIGAMFLAALGATARGDDAALKAAFTKERPTLQPKLRNRDPAIRKAAVETLATFPIADAAKLLTEQALADSDPEVRKAAYEALLGFKDSRPVCDYLIDALNKSARRRTLDPSAPAIMAVLLSSSLAEVGTSTDRYLNETLAPSPGGPLFVAMLADNLGAHGTAADLPALGKLVSTKLFEQHFAVRRAVIQAIANVPDKQSVEMLVGIVRAVDGECLADVAQYLIAVSGQPLGLNPQGWVDWWAMNKETYQFPAAMPSRPPRNFGERATYAYYGIPIYAKRAVFIIDTSSSMQGGRIEAAKRELNNVVQSLKDDVHFGIVDFNSRVSAWKPRLVPAISIHKAEAAQFIGQLQANGMTASYDALEASFAFDAEAVFFLTDGAPSSGKIVDPRAIVEAVTKGNKARRETIYTLGIGAGEVGSVFDVFLRELAAQNFGEYKRVDE